MGTPSEGYNREEFLLFLANCKKEFIKAVEKGDKKYNKKKESIDKNKQ